MIAASNLPATMLDEIRQHRFTLEMFEAMSVSFADTPFAVDAIFPA